MIADLAFVQISAMTMQFPLCSAVCFCSCRAEASETTQLRVCVRTTDGEESIWLMLRRVAEAIGCN